MTNQPDLELPAKIFAEAVVRSTSGESLLDTSQLITSDNVSLFYSPKDDLEIAKERLRSAGFEVLDIGKTSINIAASPSVFERSFKANLAAIERPVIKEFSQQTTATFINSLDAAPFGEIDITDTTWADLLDGVSINEPAYYLQQPTPSATPPQTNARYLQVPDELAEALSATLAHQAGITGKGVSVVAVDSGCYVDHPFFKGHRCNLKVVLGPGATNPAQDTNGHGTGIAANVFAIAPEVDLTVLKADVALQNKTRHVNSTAAFRRAVSLQPDIITCSWGSDLRSPYQLSSSHKILAAEIAEAIRQGIVVIFAAGNGQWGFPSQHPDVVAVGGVYKHLEGPLKGRLEASNYASSFISAIYPNRRVPDICGLVGQLPNAAYIMLPVPPGSDTDKSRSILGDQTEGSDGWAAFSGTSSAAPQLAGACALLEQFVPRLGPLKIKQILQETASDILEGGSNPSSGGGQARDGPDLATGYGLAVAYEAMQAAKKAKVSQSQYNSAPIQDPSESFAQADFIKTIENQSVQLLSENNIQRAHVMSLDDSTLKELRKKIDEIQIDLNTYLSQILLSKNDKLSQIELVINEDNFIDCDPQSQTISFLLETIRELIVADDGLSSTVNPGVIIQGKLKPEAEFRSLIKEKHVSAAKSLLSQDQCEELSKKILIKAMRLSGFKVVWIILDEGEISESDYRKLKTKSRPEGTILIDGPSEGISENEEISIDGHFRKIRDLKNKFLIYERISLDEVARMATEAIGNVKLKNSSEAEDFLNCEGDCCPVDGHRWWNSKTKKVYPNKPACQSAS